MRLLWTQEAVGDDFYAAKNLRAAAVIYNSILDDAEILKTNLYIAQIDLFRRPPTKIPFSYCG